MLEALQWKQQHKKQVRSDSVERDILCTHMHTCNRKINKKQIVIGVMTETKE